MLPVSRPLLLVYTCMSPREYLTYCLWVETWNTPLPSLYFLRSAPIGLAHLALLLVSDIEYSVAGIYTMVHGIAGYQ